MGVYIKDMEMPNCDECFWCIGHRIKCPAGSKDVLLGGRHPDCPLVPVPPHGRLIDADALVDKHFGKEYLSKTMTADKDDMGTALVNVPLVINNAPTIIPAEEART